MERHFTILFLLFFCSISFAQVPALNIGNPMQKKITQSSKQLKVNSEELIQTDFELEGGLILIDAELNGKTKKFIFDTGAPHLFLNSKLKAKKNSKCQVIGVGGNQKLAKIKNQKINWAGKIQSEQNSYAMDLSHIENAKNISIGGLLGYDEIKGKELVIDYKNQKLFLISRKNKTFFKNHEKVDKVYFGMSNHIPVIKVKIGKKNYYFGIDTGAEVNIISKKILDKIKNEHKTEIGKTKILGVSKKISEEKYIAIKSTKVGKHNYGNMKFVSADLSYFNRNCGLELDGFLGYSFLKQANFSINYHKRQLIRWEPKSNSEDVNLVKTDELEIIIK